MMHDKVIGKSVDFKIEVEDMPLRVLIVFDRKTEVALVSWQDAFNFAEVMQRVIEDVTADFMRVYPIVPRRTVIEEQAQLKFTHHKGLVAFVPEEWTDRIAFTSLEAFNIVRQALRKTAQDAHLLHDKGVMMVYARGGINLKEIRDKSGHVQKVR